MQSISLKDLESAASGVLTNTENTLATMLNEVTRGDEVSNAELLKFNVWLSISNLTTNITVGIVKERTDLFKGVAQKF